MFSSSASDGKHMRHHHGIEIPSENERPIVSQYHYNAWVHKCCMSMKHPHCANVVPGLPEQNVYEMGLISADAPLTEEGPVISHELILARCVSCRVLIGLESTVSLVIYN